MRPASSLISALTLLSLLVAVPAHSETSARDVDGLSKASEIYVATVRKDGNQSKPAPVWFIMTKDKQVLIETSPNSWKAKRIRRGSPAIVWIGRSDGPAFIGKAEITTDSALQQQVLDEYPRKYFEARVGFFRPTREKINDNKICVIRIIPVRDLPDGFASSPGGPAPKLEAAR